MSATTLLRIAAELAAGYDGDIPIYQIVPRNAAEAVGVEAALRQLRRAGLLRAGPPGYLRLG